MANPIHSSLPPDPQSFFMRVNITTFLKITSYPDYSKYVLQVYTYSKIKKALSFRILQSPFAIFESVPIMSGNIFRAP